MLPSLLLLVELACVASSGPLQAPICSSSLCNESPPLVKQPPLNACILYILSCAPQSCTCAMRPSSQPCLLS